jgi:hypothetical protein
MMYFLLDNSMPLIFLGYITFLMYQVLDYYFFTHRNTPDTEILMEAYRDLKKGWKKGELK